MILMRNGIWLHLYLNMYMIVHLLLQFGELPILMYGRTQNLN